MTRGLSLPPNTPNSMVKKISTPLKKYYYLWQSPPTKRGCIFLTGFAVFLFIFSFAGRILAGEFVIPLPPHAKAVQDVEIPLAGDTIKGHSYSTSLSRDDAGFYYRDIFAKAGFVLTSQKPVEPAAQLFTFTRDNQSCYVRIETSKGATLVSLTSYVNSSGPGGPDLKKMTWQDMLKMLPQEDVPGADLDIIPRPPNSVRVMVQIHSNTAILGYLSKTPLENIKDFYLAAMSDYEWKNFSAGKTKDAFDRADKQGEEYKNKLGQVKTLGMPIGQLAEDAVNLTFEGPKGKADIMLMNSDLKKGAKVMVTIAYTEKKEIYEEKGRKRPAR